MDNVIDKICKRFLGISLTGSIYDKRRICMQLIRTITELYNIEAVKRLEPVLSIGDLSTVNKINIDTVYSNIIELCNNYIGICNRRIPKIARNVKFEPQTFDGITYPAWTDGKYNYIDTSDEGDYSIINVIATPSLIVNRTNDEQKTIRLLDEDAPYEYLITISGKIIVVNSLVNCFRCSSGSPMSATKLTDEDYRFILNANWNVANITEMSYMFSGCDSLKDITVLANWNVANVSDMSYMFQGCSMLTTTNGLANWNISNVKNTGFMFGGCDSLENIDAIVNWNVTNIADMSGMFNDCDKLPDAASATSTTAIKEYLKELQEAQKPKNI